MKNLYNENEASTYKESPLAMRVYTSRLLGQSADLVLHGGGNTSVKIDNTLYVKGSGWNLETIETKGFSPVKLNVLQQMAKRDNLNDSVMVKEQREALLDNSAPNPSVEAILHAIIPFDFVDHTHADAVVTISNTPRGKQILKELYGSNILIIGYVMPGFELAKDIYKQTKDIDWSKLEGIVLLNHGVFTFSNSAKDSYEKMIELVNISENYLNKSTDTSFSCVSDMVLLAALGSIEDKIGNLREEDVEMTLIDTPIACAFSKLENLEEIVHRGLLTPEHVIRIKPFPALINSNSHEWLESFLEEYDAYFNRHTQRNIKQLDSAPRWAVIKDLGVVIFGKDEKESIVIKDIVEHNILAMMRAEQLGGWQSLSEADVFAMEYWELEQAKLKK